MMNRRLSTGLAFLVTVAVLVAGCSSGPEGTEVQGTVTAATGIEALESFVVTEDDGGSVQLSPSGDFNRSIDDMRDLVITGEVVFVEFERASTGEYIALSLEEEWRR